MMVVVVSMMIGSGGGVRGVRGKCGGVVMMVVVVSLMIASGGGGVHDDR